ncbi:pirin family protein [Lunatimonas salinarum]|uniref:pirin family protein n=1 Tax=Lunatimonas salinarum TaxID=1774590 RepID=UPI001ADF22A8|nr:pirin family protein [Lunatimonas salinarum]
MSNIQLIIEERERSIGSFMVGRLLPFRKKRMVGPFAFIDHMGPVTLSASENFDVPPHPHIGLSTLTFLFEGSIMHRDSVGSNVEIKPGAVNWMTAGKGVVHSERTPDYLRGIEKNLHGLQIWVALPKHTENIEPSFVHVAAEEIPQWEDKGVQFKLIAGEALGKKSPVPVYSPLYMIEIKSTEPRMLDIGNGLFGESGLYILNGEIKAEGNTFGARQILIAENAKLCSFEIGANTTIYLFGGDPFPEERFIYWNFIHSDREVIEGAKERWQAQKFPKIEGESDFVPLPT